MLWKRNVEYDEEAFHWKIRTSANTLCHHCICIFTLVSYLFHQYNYDSIAPCCDYNEISKYFI